MSSGSAATIDRFIDALWIEDGLAANTLAAYRRDLALLAAWLGEHGAARARSRRARPTCAAYAVARHAGSARDQREPAPDGVQALLPLGLARAADRTPTRRCACGGAPAAARAEVAVAKRRSRRCSPRPTSTRRSACATATMLELMYASGLRVSELVGAEDGAASASPKACCGSPARAARSGWCRSARRRMPGCARYLARGAGRDPRRRSSDALFVTARGGPMTRQMFWKLVKAHAPHGRHRRRRCRRTPCAMPSPRTC